FEQRGPEGEAVIMAYARQLPAADCALIERYTRSFNYPDTPSVKTKADLPKYGIKTFFCSNVCAMYRASTYQKLGGFEKKTIFNEDMIFAGKIILNGGSIAYVPTARVIHSHNYGNLEQLHRNFDLAVSQAEHPEIFALASSESEGMKLVKQTAGYLVKSGHPWLLPELVVKSGFKFIGYRLGKAYRKLPESLVKRLSMNKNYWEK
ncbi:MAG: glycosyltransferase family 2 protein, partial [Lachnospiraceae bacterium]|nr:glycosyltransferase family 2 protein [Lachnospiraceae bacterium]